MIRTVPLHFYRLSSTKLGLTPSPGTIHTECMAQCNNKEGTIQTHHGTHPTSSPISVTLQNTHTRNQNATNETGMLRHQGSAEKGS